MTDVLESPMLPREPDQAPVRQARAKAKRRTAKPKPKAAPLPDEFAGMTVSECAAACKEHRCVITHNGFCGHPRKGGLQGADAHKPDVASRFERAKKALQHAKVDGR